MKIKPGPVALDGTTPHVDVTLDNGEWFRIYEERPSASQCELRIVKDSGRIAVMPVNSTEVRIGRAQ